MFCVDEQVVLEDFPDVPEIENARIVGILRHIEDGVLPKFDLSSEFRN